MNIPFVTPRYIKDGKLLAKGVKRWLSYKEDLLSSEQISTIRRLREGLIEGVNNKDKKKVEESARVLNDTCGEAVPVLENAKITENIEAILVCLVLVLGFKAFILKPFRIPTGSMQPSLNGVIATPVEEWGDEATLWNYRDREVVNRPGFVNRVIDRFVFGTKYLDIKAKEDAKLVPVNGRVWHPKSFLNLFNWTEANLSTGSKLRIGVSRRESIDPGSPFNLRKKFADGKIEKNEVIARGRVRTGDFVVVNRMAYHFRKPKRGEVFVFGTKGIRGIKLDDQRMGSIHYIKRLAGVPGDKLEVKFSEEDVGKRFPQGQLYVNDEKAKETGLKKVMEGEGLYRGYGPGRYANYSLKDRQYWALGDNSHSSLDSRAWGYVPEENITGSASFVLWPFGPHWGLIR